MSAFFRHSKDCLEDLSTEFRRFTLLIVFIIVLVAAATGFTIVRVRANGDEIACFITILLVFRLIRLKLSLLNLMLGKLYKIELTATAETKDFLRQLLISLFLATLRLLRWFLFLFVSNFLSKILDKLDNVFVAVPFLGPFLGLFLNRNFAILLRISGVI